MTAIPARELAEYAEQNRLLAAYYRAAADLANNTAREAAAGITHETDDYSRLNDAATAAAKALPKSLRHVADA